MDCRISTARSRTDCLLAYTAHSNRDAKPFRWTKSAEEILQSIKRFCLQTPDSGH